MATNDFLNTVDNCDCNQMRYAYMHFDRKDTLIYEPYREFMTTELEISDIGDFVKGDGKTFGSYCWTKISDFTIPEPTDLDLTINCGDRPRNMDFNPIECNNIKFKGWLKSINIENPMRLCAGIETANLVERMREKAARKYMDIFFEEFFRGAFSPVIYNCVEKRINEFSYLTLDESSTGITMDTFSKLQTLYGIATGEPLSNITVFLSVTGYNQLKADMKTINSPCCDFLTSHDLTKSFMMYDPATHIKFVVVSDLIMERAAGNKQWMLALNSRYDKFIYGSNYLTAARLRNSLYSGMDSCYHFKDISGYGGIFNMVEVHFPPSAGKTPAEYVSYWMLNAFVKTDKKGVVLIKGKV